MEHVSDCARHAAMGVGGWGRWWASGSIVGGGRLIGHIEIEDV